MSRRDTSGERSRKKRLSKQRESSARKLKESIRLESQAEDGAEQIPSAHEAAALLTKKHAPDAASFAPPQNELSAKEAVQRLKAPPTPVVAEAVIEEPVEEAPSAWQRYDLTVLLIALVLMAGAAFAHRTLTEPLPERYDNHGLSFERPSGWLATTVGQPRAELARAVEEPEPRTAPEDPATTRLIFQAPGTPLARIEVEILPRPDYPNLRAALNLARLAKYGELYWAESSADVSIARRDWMRSRYRYAFKPSKSGSPMVATAIEYASLGASELYVVTVHDDNDHVDDLDELVRPSLRVRASDQPKENP